jgi:hypothetical protein
MAATIAQWERAHRLAQSENPAAVPDLEHMIGAAYVHKAEIDNVIYREPGDRCLLSAAPGPRLSSTKDFDEEVRRLVA